LLSLIGAISHAGKTILPTYKGLPLNLGEQEFGIEIPTIYIL